MPWELKEADGKFCVHKKGDTEPLKCYRNKGRAESYMRALYANSPEAKATLEFTGNFITFDLSASEQDPRFLVFRNAILARAEVNANNDELFPEGIDELAKTLTGCPINDEHSDDYIGIFTAGRRTDDDALSTDGVIWADRWPEIVAQVQQGKKGLSVEANAKKIKCTKCGQEFQPGDGTACAHIISTRAKRLYNARRQLSGMTAKGGATVLAPAGTGTSFSNELYMVANQGSDMNLICGYCSEDVIPNQDGNCPKCGINVEASITQPDIVATWKPKEGQPSTEGRIKMTPEELKAKEEAEQKAAKEAADLKAKEEAELKAALEAEITKLKAALDEATQKLVASEKALVDEKAAKAVLEARYTSKVLASVLEGEDLTAAVEKAKGMTLDQIDLVASLAGKSGKSGRSNLGHLDLSGAAGNGTQTTKEKLTL